MPRKISIDELKLFEMAHMFISEISSRCLKAIREECLPSIMSIHPYFNYEYNLKNSFSGFNFEEDVVKNLVNSFKSHKAVSTIRESLKIVPKIKNDISEKELSDIIETTIQQIYRSGIFNPPNEIRQLRIVSDNNSSQYHISKICFAITSLKSSLLTLNQILYQAFLYDKLLSFNEENVFSVGSRKTHCIGSVLEVSTQPLQEEVFFLDSESLIYLNIPNGGLYKGLASIESINNNLINQECGPNFTYELRIVNDDLSFFPNLS
ncbi:hypothetical protein QUF50_09440 [Thiotrichales bacterium HSG1]|nr:hypothetical protein [Thiotrichales bacterium HSG1]